jgi:hypothetical protein
MHESVLRMQRFIGDAALPCAYDAFFSRLAACGKAEARAWLENVRLRRVGPGSEYRLYVAEDSGGAPLALFPAIYSRLYLAHPRARVLHFVQPDGEPYTPLVEQADAVPAASLVQCLLDQLAAELPRYDVLRASPLDPDSAFAIELARALRRAIHPLRTERLAPGRRQLTAGVSHAEFIAARPEPLQELLRNGKAELIESGRASLRLIRDPQDLEAGWKDYCAILGEDRYVFEGAAPDYARGLMDIAARAGTLRLGFIHVDGVAAAVQFWLLSGALARCLRIWSGPEFIGGPVDDLLTEYMSRRLIDVDRVAELDFGAIAEEFARSWAPKAYRRIGLIAFNPRTSRGLRGAVRHLGAAAFRAVWPR